MNQHLHALALVVPGYDEAINFYVATLGFELVEDTELNAEKRWVRVRPKGGQASLLLAKATTEDQRAAVGDQAGGRVFLFLHTDDFERDYAAYTKAGVSFTEAPRDEAYGRVVVFRDPFGNLWDLIEPK